MDPVGIQRRVGAVVAGLLLPAAVATTPAVAKPAAHAHAPAHGQRAAKRPAPPAAPIPHLRRDGQAMQLIVGGQPFLGLAGELGNSSSSTPASIDRSFDLLRASNLNTVIVPVAWNQLEPREGRFDFRLVDRVIARARAAGKKVVIAWFGSWKNSASTYAPAWVLRDHPRFPLAQVRRADGRTGPVQVLSPLGAATRAADAAAFARLMERVRQQDPRRTTVVMAQVQNEVGLLSAARGSDYASSRDVSPQADAAFAQQVPATLTRYLAAHRADLQPRLRAAWEAAGSRTSGTWAEVFGAGPTGEEAFMAWSYAQYVDAVAAAGRKRYDLPMFVNAWIEQPSYREPGGPTPGQYPSGGPVVAMHDVWRAGAPSIDALAPDVYLPDFPRIYDDYLVNHGQNAFPGLVPESANGFKGAANAFWAFGRGAIAYSPFGIDRTERQDPSLRAAYGALHQLSGLVLRGQASGTVRAVYLNPASTGPEVRVPLGNGYDATFSLSYDDPNGIGYAIALPLGGGRFALAGRGVVASLSRTDGRGVATVARDSIGRWVGGHDANGGNRAGGRWVASIDNNGDEISGGYYFGDQMAGRRAPTQLRLRGNLVHRVRLLTY